MARIESSVTSDAWIPLNAMQGIQKLAADLAGAARGAFDQVERRLRGVEGLSVARREGRGTPPGRRTATLRAVTACRVAVVPEGLLDREALAALASQRRRASRDV
jgi:hypothetical protein